MAESTYTAPATYTITFPSLSQSEVKVSIDGVLQSSGFTISGYATSGSGTVAFTSAPTAGSTVRIFRDTTILSNQLPAPKSDFQPGASIKAEDLNVNMDQVLYKLAEKIDDGDISNDAVVTQGIRDLNVTTAKIADSNVTTAKIADGNVTTAKIADSSVTTAKIADSSIVSAKYANESVGSAALAASSVTEAKLASNSVTTAKIADNAVTLAKLNSGALPTDITVASANIVDGTIATDDIANDAVTNAKIATDAVNADSVQDGTLSSAKLTAATVVTNTEQAASTPNDTSFFTTSASDGRYFRQDSTETITSGVTWTSDNARVATTGAIDARIVDLVEEVGGFVPIANETSFPAANPDVNNGAGTIVSVSAIGASRTPSSGTVTITDGAGTGNTVTITGVGSQVLTAGFGVLLETTSTLHTYTFHRLTPPATNVNTVATNIADVNTVAGNNANVTTVAGISSNVTTVATNNSNVSAVGNDIANVNTAAGSIANINTVASDLNEATSEIDTVATNIANVNTVGTDITNVNTVATNINSVNSFSDVYRIASSDPTTNLNTGDLVFNTTNNALRVYNGTSWQDGATAAGNFMSKTGDAMTGNLNMQTNKVENLADATASGDAVSKSFMDTAIDTALTTDVIGGQSITVTDNSPGSGQISVAVTGGSIGPTQLASTAVTAGTYGASQSGVPSFTVDADGRITAASNDTSPTFAGPLDVTTTVGGTNVATFVSSGSNSYGLKVQAGGAGAANYFADFRKQDNSSVFKINGDSSIVAAGSITAAGGATLGDDTLSSSNGLVARNNNAGEANSTIWAINKNASGYVFIGNDENVNVTSSIANDGSATFASDVSAKALIGDRSDSGAAAVFLGRQGGTETSRIKADGSATFAGNVTLTANLDMQDNDKILLGTGDDLQIYHDGNNSFIKDSGTGRLSIVTSQLQLTNAADSEVMMKATENGAVELYYDNSKKLETKSDGIDITGELQCDTLDVDGNADITGNIVLNGDLDLQDSNSIKLGTNDDLSLTHNGSNSHIENYTGGLYIDQNLNDGSIHLRSDNSSGGLADYIKCQGSSGEVFLYHYGSQKFKTKSDGIAVTGKATCDTLRVNTTSDFAGDAEFTSGAGAVTIAGNSDIRLINGNWTGEYACKIQAHANFLYMQGGSAGFRFRSATGTDRCSINSSGHFEPANNNTYDLGTSSKRWRNVYTNDLNLSNEGSTNDVDGTWGNYTIQEGEDDLFLINRRNGKKYKFNLTEVN